MHLMLLIIFSALFYKIDYDENKKRKRELYDVHEEIRKLKERNGKI